MNERKKYIIGAIVCALAVFALCICIFVPEKPKVSLDKWNKDGVITKVTEYVSDVTNENSANFIPVSDRIAVFDLDGTLLGEHAPIYVEWVMYCCRVLDDPSFEATDEMKQLAAEILTAAEEGGSLEEIEKKESVLFGQAFDGMTIEEYREYVRQFLTTPADGFDNLTFADAYFRPMQQVVEYLEANDFTIYICSGTDREFDRVMASEFLDIPMYHIIGTDYYSEGANHDDVFFMDYNFDPDEEVVRDDTNIIKNVKSSKIVQLSQELGQKPVLAFGNSTGDMSMFEYTTFNNPYRSAAFCLIPDDDDRDYEFPQKIENLTNMCNEHGWNVVSMKNDFLVMYGEGVTKNAGRTPLLDKLKGLCE